MEMTLLASAKLFEADEDGERVSIVCGLDDTGGLRVHQVSEGPMTQWCYEESPHTVDVSVDAAGLDRVAQHLQVERAEQVPAALQVAYAGLDGSQRVRELLRELGVPYQVDEASVRR